MIYLDTETELIEQGRLAPPLVCAQVARGDEPPWFVIAGVDPAEELLGELLTGGDVIVGHNIAYDMLVFVTEYPSLWSLVLRAYEEDRVTDTMLRERLIAIAAGDLKRRKFSLAALAKRYGERKDGRDPWRSRYGELRGVPLERWPRPAREYALHDVVATRAVYLGQTPAPVTVPPINIAGEVLVERIADRPVSPDEYRQARAGFLLHVISGTGVRTDPAAIRELERQVERERQADLDVLHQEGLVRRDGSRNVNVARDRMVAACHRAGLEVPRTKTGQVAVDEAACSAVGDPLLEAYQRFGSWTTFQSRIKRLWKGVDVPLTARFTSLVETGRTSCSAGDWGYQIQNMRRQAGERECFVPREPGHVFLACDFDSFELCSLAQICIWTVGYSELGEAINRGLDPHLAMAARSLRRDYDELVKIKGDSAHPEHKAIKRARQGCKIANFGYPGGMGAGSFVAYAAGYGMDLTVEEAERLKNDWLRAWPEMEEYFRWIGEDHDWHTAIRQGEEWKITTVRHPRSGRIRGGCGYTVACNSYFQGLAADAAKASGWALLRATIGGELDGWKIWNFVHDEFLLEGPEEDGDRAARVVQRIMVETASEWMPDVKIGASPALMRRWRKDAEPVYRDGRLVPWEDR